MNTNGKHLPAAPGPPALLGMPRHDSPLMYVWEAVDGQGRKQSGVTGFRHRATLDLFQAMRDMPDPGAKGTLRAAMLNTFARQPVYVYTPVLMRLCRDDVTGGIRVEGGDLR
ncbi:hypothetical protein [Streptosporangium sp. KLBMP 9127]|nr:hypothetical protein [Streptosporangium sp. KLBMP 9127]